MRFLLTVFLVIAALAATSAASAAPPNPDAGSFVLSAEHINILDGYASILYYVSKKDKGPVSPKLVQRCTGATNTTVDQVYLGKMSKIETIAIRVHATLRIDPAVDCTSWLADEETDEVLSNVVNFSVSL